MSIQVQNVSKRFGGFVALDDVSLEVPDGSLLSLLGPSGSGKTTLLRIIAGLEVADQGRILHGTEDITDHAACDRQVGFVFQHYALFRHMTVAENVGYGLRVRGRPKSRIAERVRELLALVRLEGLDDRYPSQLSGGQRQRVALARALAAEPRVLLLDEPFGALDANVRHELREWLRRLHEEIHVTSIFVTHDQEEAFEVADRVVVMNNARIEQVGTPDEVYDQPASPFVYHFLGKVNKFAGRIVRGRFRVGATELALPSGTQLPEASVATAYVRPHEVKLQSDQPGSAGLGAVVRHVNSAGPVVHVSLERSDDGSPFLALLTKEECRGLTLRPSSLVYAFLKNARIFPEEAG
ncbi:MAG: TOBE-like domain-containing protein [Verrucomicrobia bacterium]|nr:TOBE-like domain-containing protein [Verrucomicrobiota bacterium]